jgi:hypothetical protein
MPRERSSTAAAPISPKTAPDAPTVGTFGLMTSAPKDPHNKEVKYSAANRPDPSTGSSMLPRIHNRYMLKRMWIGPACRKPELTSR